MSIRSKLVLGFGIVYLLLLSVGLVSYHYMAKANQRNDRVFRYANHFDKVMKLRHEVKQMVFIYKLFLSGQKNRASLDLYDVDLKMSFADLKRVSLEKEIAVLVGKMERNYRRLDHNGKAFKSKVKRDIAIAMESDEVIFDRINLLLDTLLDQSLALNNLSKNLLKDMTVKAQEQQNLTLTVIVAANSLALVLAFFCTAILMRSILKPIKRLKKAIRQATQGHWSEDIPITSKDELGQLSEDFNKMMAGFKATRSQLKGQSEAPLDQFVKKITLDFNNVLSAILGVATMLKSNFKDNPDVERQLDVVVQAADQGTHLANKLRSYSGQNVTEYVDFSMADLVHDCCELLRRSNNSGIEISYESSDHIWPIFAHRASFMNVILNLGMNACEAMEKGGKLTYKIKNKTIEPGEKLAGLVDPGEYNWLVVEDTGMGIPDHVLKKVFEPFFTTKSGENRAGLGLTLTMEIVKSFGGEMYIDSVLGQGTSIHVFVPANADPVKIEAPEKTVSPLDAKVKGNAKTVLVIDDEPLVTEVIKEALTMVGAKVHVSNTAKAGLEDFAQYYDQVDVVIVDWIMPDMNGIEVCHKLLSAKADLKVVITSGQPENQEIYLLVDEYENVSFVGKPFTPEELHAAAFS